MGCSLFDPVLFINVTEAAEEEEEDSDAVVVEDTTTDTDRAAVSAEEVARDSAAVDPVGLDAAADSVEDSEADLTKINPDSVPIHLVDSGWEVEP